jgi:hypothetical protein
MKHSQKKETREKVNTLLRQYKEYNEAPAEAEKNRIGDDMTYADPIIWMMYKHKAYKGSDHEINTLGDLKEHSVDHGGICAKRMRFLGTYIKNIYGKDILDSSEFSDDTNLVDFYDSNLLNEVVNTEAFINEWQKNEFFKKNGVVAKWSNYF